MTQAKVKSFRAVLEATGTHLHWVIVRIPIDLKRAWPGWKTRRVRGEINGFAFATTLFPGAKGVGLTLLVNKKMQAGAHARAGDEVRITVEPEMDAGPREIAPELEKELKADKQLQQWFGKISPSMQRGISNFVDQAKGAGTRKSRAEKMAESLMLAMEGELEPPPLLRAAFQRQPLAKSGWEAMTPTQRKRHLLGIFYVQTVRGRERRAAQAVEECLRVARKKTAY
ncbi:MAG TPA: YdeI/OmpD-associated family protein [Terracidiphilus sp.]|jgi:uncharacterized protein YdeI (YjbR/CyaY-like superfamily)|nr:YdeI/OmpD-associated family protein [Terracidiphilus sp.]